MWRRPDVRLGKHVVIVVVSELGSANRHRIVTASVARTLAEGDVEWSRTLGLQKDKAADGGSS